jgi:predicted Zn finger-like uncharacterized protein
MMLTRCPGCTTTFRVTPEQVKARHGKVRCGRCQHIFDAIEFLVDAPAAAPTAPSVSLPISPQEEPRPALAPEPQPVAEHVVDDIVPADPEPVEAQPQLEDVNAPPPPAAENDDILLQPSPLSTAYAQTAAARHPSWPWTIAATLAFLILIAQLMVAFRSDLAVKYPEVRPLLDMLCVQAQCSVELPSDPDLASIESSDLHPAKQGGLELTATLRNRAPHAQAWPHLELTLTDGADKPIVRKVIEPAQYLPATQSEADGFAANGEQAVQLLLDAGTLPAAGYRLYLFYP